MPDRVVIPSSIPVPVRVGDSGSVPGAIPSQAPVAGGLPVYSRINPTGKTSSPYSNVQPSIGSAGSGVQNPAPRGNPNYVGSPQRNPYGANYRSSPAPTVAPYRNAPTHAWSLQDLERMNQRRLNPNPIPDPVEVPQPRAAAAPATPIPPANPAINPQNIRRAVHPLQRIVAPAARILGAASQALPYIGAAADFASGLNQGESLGEAALEAGGALAGGLWGAAQGAGAGAAAVAPLAAAFPPAAPLIIGGAGLAGGLAGGVAGWNGGGFLADRFHRFLFPNDGSNPALDPTAPLQPVAPPPFYGGQGNGTTYRVDYRIESTRGGVPQEPWISFISPLAGPIRSMRVVTTPNSWVFAVTHGTPAQETLGGGGTFGAPAPEFTLTYARPTRTDGQPDTDGNPAPLPGTPTIILSPANAPSRPVSPPSGAPGQPELAPAPPGDPLAPTSPPTAAPPVPTAPTGRPGINPATPPAPTPENPFPNIPPWLPLLAIPRPGGGTGAGAGATNLSPPGTTLRGSLSSRIVPPGTTPQTPSVPTINIPGTGSQPQAPTCFYDNKNIKGSVDDANVRLQTIDTNLNILNTLVQGTILNKVNTIDNKLGPQLTGGISGVLSNVFNFSKKTWKFLQIDRVLNLLSWIGIMHNAYMLSNGLTQTLFSAISSALDATGLDEFLNLRDEDDGPIDVGALAAKVTESFFQSIFGVETVDGFKAAWKKYNRIYQAAANIIYSVQSMVYSMVEILETISNYTGKIGNALMRSGTILQNSFNWMNTNANYLDNRFFRFLQRTQDGVELVEQIFSEVVSIQEMGAELANQSEEFSNAVEALEEAEATTENQARADQKRPLTRITPSDETRAEVNE